MDNTPVVALLVDSRTRYGRTILQGIEIGRAHV
jgi:hypothetical protein